MSKRTNEFQKIALRIYSALGGTGAQVEESAMLKEKNSTSKREVDILITSTIAGHTVTMAVECRDHGKDQDITWVDGLIGKYSNLDVHKVVAVSHSDYTSTAFEKAKQHRIELLTLKEAETADWAAKVGPRAIQFFGFRNRPLRVGLRLKGSNQLKLEYSFEGESKADTQAEALCAPYFLRVWDEHMSHVAGQKLGEFVFNDWNRFTATPSTPRYWEITQTVSGVSVINLPNGQSLQFDEIVWGVGTKYSIEEISPTKWSIGDKAASMASTVDDQGQPVHITLVSDQSGRFLGANVEVK